MLLHIRLSQASGAVNVAAGAAAAGAASFFRQQAVAATHAYWQILQLVPTSTPGQFKVSLLRPTLSLHCCRLTSAAGRRAAR